MDRVYIRNLPPDIRVAELEYIFGPFGKLDHIDVNTGLNPVCAYVQFDNARNAFNAVKYRHGYNYEGYTLQLRLAENEVRSRRDATPPPPPPMFGSSSYELKNKSDLFKDNYSAINNRMLTNHSNTAFSSDSTNQWPNNNRYGTSQQQPNMIQYPINNRVSMMSQQNMDYSASNRQQNIYPDSGSANMTQQYSNTNRSNMPEQYTNPNLSNIEQLYSNRSNMTQQSYSNSTRSNMSQQNMNYPNFSDISEQDIMPYSSNTRSNIQQQFPNANCANMLSQQQNNMMGNMNWNAENQQQDNMMGYSNNGNMNWNVENYGNGYNNEGRNDIHDPIDDKFDKSGFVDSYTKGLSGCGRKWFNRYIRQGFSPEMARVKALEHRTVPYLRDQKNNQIPNDALATIGNTIISLLGTNPVDNLDTVFTNNTGNMDKKMPVPSSSRSKKIPGILVSRRQYLKSKDILRNIERKHKLKEKDIVRKNFRLRIVEEYEQQERRLGRNKKPVISGLSQDKIEEKIRSKKGELIRAAKDMQGTAENKRKRFGGAGSYKKRVKILIHEVGFSDLEAKSLALHPLEKLQSLMDLKKEYDSLTEKTEFIPTNGKSLKDTPKIVIYRNDIKYLKTYQQHKISELSQRIINALNVCITRIHKYERGQNLPLTTNKFVTLLQKVHSAIKRGSSNKNSSAPATTTNKTKENNNEDTTASDEEPQEEN